MRMTHSPTQAALLAREESKSAQLITLYFSVQHTAASLHLASKQRYSHGPCRHGSRPTRSYLHLQMLCPEVVSAGVSQSRSVQLTEQ